VLPRTKKKYTAVLLKKINGTPTKKKQTQSQLMLMRTQSRKTLEEERSGLPYDVIFAFAKLLGKELEMKKHVQKAIKKCGKIEVKDLYGAIDHHGKGKLDKKM